MRKKNRHGYLDFSRKEKNGTLVVLVIVLLGTAWPFLYPFIFTENITQAHVLKADLDSLQVKNVSYKYPSKVGDDESDSYQPYNQPAKKYAATAKTELFYFDPNTISVAEWQRLGVTEKTATGILHYTEKGGRFKQPGDIKKIWGIRPELADKLQAYVKITDAGNSNGYVPKTYPQYEAKTYPKYEPKVYEKKTVQPVDINAGDTTAYIALPGIGSKLASRIVTFRNRLGGFYSTEQVGETFGLPDSTFQIIKPFLKASAEGVKQININTATPDELKAHPYIRWQFANLIIQYRVQHGPYADIKDLKKIMLITDEAYNKMAPYLTTK